MKAPYPCFAQLQECLFGTTVYYYVHYFFSFSEIRPSVYSTSEELLHSGKNNLKKTKKKLVSLKPNLFAVMQSFGKKKNHNQWVL